MLIECPGAESEEMQSERKDARSAKKRNGIKARRRKEFNRVKRDRRERIWHGVAIRAMDA
jgi:hypothetical protein